MSADAEAVWRRAVEGGGPDARVGDQALAAALRFHRRALAVGVWEAAFDLDPIELEDTIDGFGYLGLADAAALVESVAANTMANEAERFDPLNQSRYTDLVNDEVLRAAYRARFDERRDEFAPA